MSTDIITVKDLTFYYPGASEAALQNINLSVRKGEFVGITGPAGAGKSTLSLCFNGVIPHFQVGRMGGAVYLDGAPLAQIPAPELARRVGSVFQDPEAQIVSMSVEEEIAFGMENLGFARDEMAERITRSLEMTGITGLRHRSTAALSGGQKQRVVIAAVLAMMPEVLVLDEPTSELDPLGTEEIFKILHRLNKEHGITVILIEQKTDQLAGYLDRLLVLNKGNLTADGRPAEVLARRDVIELGVKIPQVTELAMLFNLPLAEAPVTLAEGIEFIRQAAGGGRKPA